MNALWLSAIAVAMTVVIVCRVICVVYQTTVRKHRHPLLFIGFGYSYVILGAGAIFAAVALCSAHDVGDLAMWLLLIGTCGLIIFDRRAARCFTSGTDCPLEQDKERRP
jgi:hypothetical protein